VSNPEQMKLISVEALRQLGLIQEMNRRLLHPLGIALTIVMNPGGPNQLAFVDHRDVQGGVRIGGQDPVTAQEIAVAVDDLLIDRSGIRNAKYGWVIQPPSTVGRPAGAYPGELDCT